ncbi:beta-mannanase [Paenibacillus polymyxa]|uniref:beta-mannanase n=1 Tax=Paenibacillus polymyxa TaxID=1406 RepID=UPI000ED34CD3|nr:beta-mannanase [Paenibacillus polymyxa]RGL33413.1 beta-mannanase [Paenibacillus polymyxa]UMR37821.1 beta-mannanase [Paenibacillus polymyxa]WOZ40509.1 beta-mannanase [Paenibacillus polymyxa]
MQYRDAQPDDPLISELSHKIDDNRVVLRWQWPEGVAVVYIAKQSADTGANGQNEAPTSELKLFTREEYKAAGSYRDRIEGIGRVRYTVYPAVREAGETFVIRQQDGANQLELSTGRAKIKYAVHHKKSWFRSRKTVQIQVTAEVPVPQEALCYVKKRGGYPADRDDGTLYAFTAPFAAGRNVLPAIEVGGDEYVRLFFTDGQKYGTIYELVPE